MDDEPIQLFAGESDIDSLVVLKPHIDALAVLDKVGILCRDQIRQFFPGVLLGELLLSQKVVYMSYAYFLLLRYSVAGRIYIAEKFVFIPEHYDYLFDEF